MVFAFLPFASHSLTMDSRTFSNLGTAALPTRSATRKTLCQSGQGTVGFFRMVGASGKWRPNSRASVEHSSSVSPLHLIVYRTEPRGLRFLGLLEGGPRSSLPPTM